MSTAISPKAPQRGRTTALWASVIAATIALVILYGVLPAAGVDYPYGRPTVVALYPLSSRWLSFVDVTTVLTATTALTVVAVVRKLHYGIGAVLTVVLGANLLGAVLRASIGGFVLPSAVTNGQVIAAASVVAAASLVVSARVRPIVAGLGTVVVIASSLAAMVTGAASAVSIIGALLVVAIWWAGASIMMTYSPIAAARERANPLSTAAMALRTRE